MFQSCWIDDGDFQTTEYNDFATIASSVGGAAASGALGFTARVRRLATRSDAKSAKARRPIKDLLETPESE